MRLRNVPGAREVMVENEYVFTEPEGMKGTWHEVFGNDNLVRIEIGMGKGRFISTLAAQNPDINYVGIENIPACCFVPLKNRKNCSCRICVLSEWMQKISAKYSVREKLTVFI